MRILLLKCLLIITKWVLPPYCFRLRSPCSCVVSKDEIFWRSIKWILSATTLSCQNRVSRIAKVQKSAWRPIIINAPSLSLHAPSSLTTASTCLLFLACVTASETAWGHPFSAHHPDAMRCCYAGDDSNPTCIKSPSNWEDVDRLVVDAMPSLNFRSFHDVEATSSLEQAMAKWLGKKKGIQILAPSATQEPLTKSIFSRTLPVLTWNDRPGKKRAHIFRLKHNGIGPCR